jgi:hypothetical protein
MGLSSSKHTPCLCVGVTGTHWCKVHRSGAKPQPLTKFLPGDRVYGWVWTGGETQEPLYATVIRVNRRTVTVRYDAPHIDADKPKRVAPHLLSKAW